MSSSFADQSVRSVLDAVAARTATPGGGTVAALTGSAGAALCSMAAGFTREQKDADESLRSVLATVGEALSDLRRRLTALADEDAQSYESVRSARRLPRSTPEEIAARKDAIQTAVRGAAEVPLRTARLCRDGLEMVAGLCSRLNPNLATDAASGALLLRAAARAAALNASVNLLDLKDAALVERMDGEVSRVLDQAEAAEKAVLDWARSRISR